MTRAGQTFATASQTALAFYFTGIGVGCARAAAGNDPATQAFLEGLGGAMGWAVDRAH